MSVAEIIDELPKLSEGERRAIRQKLTELAEQRDDDVRICNQTALEAALMFDRMEDDDARRRKG